MKAVTTVLFDLDGTLLDTAPDMGGALNELLADHGKPILSQSTIRPHVSHGTNALVKLGFGINPDHSTFPGLCEGFLHRYAKRLCRKTQIFAGMETVLEYCESNKLPWGIVTNKPGYLTEPLLTRLNLFERAACIISGDTLPQRKPRPEPLIHACKLTGGDPTKTLYIGDAERDMEAGNNAGMVTLVAAFGYIGTRTDPNTWGANGIAQSPIEILNWIRASHV